MVRNKAIVLLSGGIDSSLLLAWAVNEGRECLALSFDYNQRHRVELESAKKIATHYQVAHKIICIDPQTFDQSSLTSAIPVPKDRSAKEIAAGGIPTTYVPARNLLFLSYALGQAELFGANEIWFGPNALDILPYPDCRPAFVEAFQALIPVATKLAGKTKLLAPLVEMNKKEIVKKALALHVPISMTHSCYDPKANGSPCLRCDACVLREEALYGQVTL